MTDPRLIEKMNTLPIPELRQLFCDINSLTEHLIENYESKGESDKAEERRTKLADQKFLQELLIEKRLDPVAFELKYRNLS